MAEQWGKKRSGRKIKVGIIDTGIDTGHPYLNGKIAGIYEYLPERKTMYAMPKTICNDSNGHGTACASVIVKECQNVQLYVYKLLDTHGESNLLALENTLHTLINTKLDVINLSLAIEKRLRSRELRSHCSQLVDQGKILVAALENDGRKSYPSAFRNCYGVMGSILDHQEDIWFNQHRQIQCVIDNTPYLHCDTECGYRMFGKSNSYAAAKMTGIIARILTEEGGERRQINRALRDMANRKLWHMKELRRSRRFPDLKQYEASVDETLAPEVERVVKEYLGVDGGSLRGRFLFDREVGMTYELCYGLAKELEMQLGFHLNDYTNISREDFYTVEHLTHMVQRQIKMV